MENAYIRNTQVCYTFYDDLWQYQYLFFKYEQEHAQDSVLGRKWDIHFRLNHVIIIYYNTIMPKILLIFLISIEKCFNIYLISFNTIKLSFTEVKKQKL